MTFLFILHKGSYTVVEIDASKCPFSEMRKLGLKFGARALSKNLFMMKNGCFT
jgi:hypothetical protein